MTNRITEELTAVLRSAGVAGEIALAAPPKSEMGDFAFPCFTLAKEMKKNPAEAAKEIESKVREQKTEIIDEVKAFGPYVNFYLNGSVAAKRVLSAIEEEGDRYGASETGRGKNVLVEYGCPNPLKAFHLGHLRNLITGESVARLLENVGYRVLRVNYQGDVGMHVAKTLWGIEKLKGEYREIPAKPLAERIMFLGRAYAYGATAFEENEVAQKEIGVFNELVYEQDPAIQDVYRTTRQWSLEYFETIYVKLGTRYDHYYFESDMYKRGVELVKTYLSHGIFLSGEGGALIFPGSAYGLHDRVFINSKGYPTYEAKELALAERHFREHHPDTVIHVVGKEQTEYFKVVIRAIEAVFPDQKGKEHHLVGGYLQLKGEQKMSSRKGNVVTGDELIEEVEERVKKIMAGTTVAHPDEVARRVSVAALKYTMLKTGVSDDIAFDMERSVGTEGDSGPYLLYIVARIKSILRKSMITDQSSAIVNVTAVEPAEKQLLLVLSEYPDSTATAAAQLDPSYVAQYLFTLAQRFNTFYHECPVLQAEGDTRAFRLGLVRAVLTVMTSGLALLGIETVEEM